MTTEGVLRVYSPAGTPIGVLPAKEIKCSWVRNAPGALTCTIPRTSRRYTAQYVEPLRRLEYHHPALPVVWVGWLLDQDPQGGDVHLTAQSAEWIYDRRLSEDWMIATGTGAILARTLHDQATRRGAVGIVPGALDPGGRDVLVQLSAKPIGPALGDLATQLNADWWVEKTGHGHTDPWRLRWVRTRGRDLSGRVILAGDVVDDPAYKRSAATLAQSLLIVGGGTGSELWQRIHYPLADRAALARDEGLLLEEVVEFPDVIDDSLLQAAGVKALALRSNATRSLGLNLDNRRGTWGRFWLADVIRVLLSNVGYTGLDARVRVSGIQVDIDAGRMGLTGDLLP